MRANQAPVALEEVPINTTTTTTRGQGVVLWVAAAATRISTSQEPRRACSPGEELVSPGTPPMGMLQEGLDPGREVESERAAAAREQETQARRKLSCTNQKGGASGLAR